MVSGVGSRQHHGFSLLELAFVLTAIGVLSLLAHFTFSGADDVRQHQQAKAEAEVVREALRYYVLANKRLPCPDFDEDGYEDRDPSGGCSLYDEMGFAPYYAIGLPPKEENRTYYGVYRAASPDDITVLEERTGDGEGEPDFKDLGDAINALSKIPATVSGNAHIYIAGVNADGSSNCDASVAAYPAFVLIIPNINRDNENGLLDGVNSNTAKCIASPIQPLTWNYDDIVVVESPNALIGWLTKHIN
ncbi:MAG: type II secretion system GspH family protein [Burkholderiales bacterium]|jgi:prepilin-type N-terminal cleavage/methylation domain-containing protein|nr:type II secretion system GspH family protein [Burkholderiales bacterium]